MVPFRGNSCCNHLHCASRARNLQHCTQRLQFHFPMLDAYCSYQTTTTATNTTTQTLPPGSNTRQKQTKRLTRQSIIIVTITSWLVRTSSFLKCCQSSPLRFCSASLMLLNRGRQLLSGRISISSAPLRLQKWGGLL